MEIRIRFAGETESKHLGEVEWDDLDQVMPTLRRWGIVNVDNMESLSGQFVVDDTAYFEVVIDDEDA